MISILLPTHGQDGREDWLALALDRIMAQTYTDFEIIIRDDGEQCVLGYGKLVSRIFDMHQLPALEFRKGVHFVRNPDKVGVYAGLNETMRAAKGDIFYFHASDDFLVDDRVLQDVAALFPALERPAWLYGKQLFCNSQGDPCGDPWGLRPSTFEALVKANRMFSASVFWNRKMLEAAGEFDEHYQCAGDYDMWIRFWKVTPPMIVQRPISYYRLHEGQDGHVRQELTAAEAQRISAHYKAT
jgi:glycosyltransferase involved in cell wall biosynthesis